MSFGEMKWNLNTKPHIFPFQAASELTLGSTIYEARLIIVLDTDFFSHKHFVGDPSCLNDQPVLITRPSLSVTRKFIIKDASEQKQKEKRCFKNNEREIRAAKLGKNDL